VQRFLRSAPSADTLRSIGQIWAIAVHVAPELQQIDIGLDLPALPADITKESLTRLVAQQPWLIILDDLHLADPASLNLLDFLARLAEHLPVMLVATVDRTDLEGQPDVADLLRRIAALPHSTSMTLQPLAQSQLAQFLQSIWSQAPPPDLIEAIHNRTGGNPLFAETIAHGLIDEGVVNWRDEKWHFGPVMEVGLPAHITDAVRRRIGRLSRETQTLLNQAAILGPTFDFDDLHELSDLSTWDALESISIALERQLLKNSPGEQILRFSHPVVQQVFYNELSRLKQRLLHREAGEALERRYLPRPKMMIEWLAFHFLQAGEPEKALPYFASAGKKAEAVYANQSALNWYTQTLKQVSPTNIPPEQHFNLLLKRDQLLYITGAVTLQAGNLKTSEALAQTLDQPGRQAMAHLRRARFELAINDIAAAATELQTALIAARQAGEPDLESKSLIRLATLALHHGQFDAAREHLYAAQNNLLPAENQAIEAQRLNSLGLLYKLLNNHTESEQYFRQAATLSRQTGDRHQQSHCLSNLGDVLLAKGELASALSCQQHALRISKLCGNRRAEARALAGLATSHTVLGNLNAAETFVNQAKTLHKSFEDEQGLAVDLRLLGQIQLHRLDFVTARDFTGQALEIFQRSKNRSEEGDTWLLLGLALEGLDHITQARHAFEQVQSLGDALKNHAASLDAAAGLARLQAFAGEHQEAARQMAAGLAQISADNKIWCSRFPIKFYLTAFELFSAAGQNDKAALALQQGQKLLQQRAETIDEPDFKQAFLTDIPQNKLLQEYVQQQKTEAPIN
jgi:predicted ATPase